MNADSYGAIGVALAGTAIGGVGLWLYVRSDNRTNERSLTREQVINPGTVSRAQLEVWLSTRGELRPASQAPPGCRRIPVIPPRWIPMVSRPTRNRLGATTATRRLYLDGMRQVLRDAGRGDEDARCVLLLMAIESGWDTAGWNCNYGNVKAQGTVWGDTSTLFAPDGPYVLTNHSVSTGVFLLRDRYASFDGYHAFPSGPAYMRWHGAFLGRRYPEVLAGYRQGDLAGLERAEEFLARRGYAERPYDGENRDEQGRRIRMSMEDYVTLRVQRARGYWRNMTEMLGSGFAR